MDIYLPYIYKYIFVYPIYININIYMSSIPLSVPSLSLNDTV